MKHYLTIIIILGGIIWIQSAILCNVREDRNRLQDNQRTLLDSITYYRTENGKNVASVQRLELSVAEVKAERRDLIEQCRNLNIKIRRLESFSTSRTQTMLDIESIVHDTVIVRRYESFVIHDTLKSFLWKDTWVTIQGLITEDSIRCHIESVDTLRQAVHRVPRKFLFIRYGTKAIRQEIFSSNPHTRIVYTEYVELKKGKRGKN